MFLCLMSLEFIVISLIIILLYFLFFYINGLYLLIFCIVFFVCEAVLGLGVLVRIIRCFSNDYLISIRLW